jgi:hypothetical protein
MTGTGTSTDPFLVATASDLCNVGNNLSAYYKQTADIDMAGVTFTPIGVSNTTAFTGTYDGDNHIISNLSINATTDYTGMFTYVNGGTLKNIKLYKEIVNSTKGYTGGLAGQIINNSSVTNCGSSGATITGVNYIGGLFGTCASNVSKCFVVGLNMTGTSIMLGGFAGAINANVSSQVTISQCFVEGTIDGTGQTFIGGFIGMLGGYYLVKDCYSKCNVKGNMYVSGFVAFAGGGTGSTVLSNCYTASPVTATTTNAGAFTGETGSSLTITNCYWDKTISIITTDKGNANSGYATAKTTAQMQTQSTFTNYDFTNIWAINSGEYPHLQYYQAINPNPTPPVTPTYKQDYHNLSSPLFGTFSPLF